MRIPGSWTGSLVRRMWPLMNLPSVFRLRDCYRREEAGLCRPGQLLELRLRRPIGQSVFLREVGSDLLTFQEVIVEQAYQGVFSSLKRCRTIMDLGANIGLASLYLSSRYPGSRCFAVEANPDTFQILLKNFEPHIGSSRFRAVQGAVWRTRCRLSAAPGAAAHYSMFRVRADAAGPIQGWTIGELIEQSRFDSIDLLKIDIEGAETEVFVPALTWLDRVAAIAVEFHGTTRQDLGFDQMMAGRGFHVHDCGHTVIAFRP